MAFPYDWEQGYDRARGVFHAAPHRPAVCRVYFHLSVDNDPASRVRWVIRVVCEGEIDTGEYPIYTVCLAPVPARAYNVGSFEFELEPGRLYHIVRDGAHGDDTALGDEAILQTYSLTGMLSAP